MQRNPNVFFLNAAQPKPIQTKPSMTQCAPTKQRTPQISSCQTWRDPNLFSLTIAQPRYGIHWTQKVNYRLCLLSRFPIVWHFLFHWNQQVNSGSWQISNVSSAAESALFNSYVIMIVVLKTPSDKHDWKAVVYPVGRRLWCLCGCGWKDVLVSR